MFPQYQVSLATQYLEFFKLCTFLRVFCTFSDDIEKVFCENEWNSLSIDAKFLLEMPEKMSEIDVKYLKNCIMSSDKPKTNIFDVTVN